MCVLKSKREDLLTLLFGYDGSPVLLPGLRVPFFHNTWRNRVEISREGNGRIRRSVLEEKRVVEELISLRFKSLTRRVVRNQIS